MKIKQIAIAVAGATLMVSQSAVADIFTATPNVDFSGTQGTATYPTITFDDENSAGTVKVTIDMTGVTSLDATATPFSSDWWFNFNGNATTLSFGSFTVDSGVVAEPDYNTCNNCTSPASFRPDGDGFHDIHLEFSTQNGTATGDRFSSGEKVSFVITGAGITAGDFNVQSMAGPGDTSNDFFCVATHMQGLGSAGDGSDFLGAANCLEPTPGMGRIIVVKQTEPDGSPALFDFTLSGGPSNLDQPFQLGDGDSHDSGPVSPGSGYVAAEQVPSGWQLATAVCDDGSPVDNIDVSADETVTCTFTDVADGTPVPEPSALVYLLYGLAGFALVSIFRRRAGHHG